MKRVQQSIDDAKTAASSANAIHVMNRKLAAAMAALGFPSNSRLVVPELTRKATIEFAYRLPSIRPEYAKLSPTVAASWENKEWKAANPHHPICVAMRANHNYDRIEDLLHGNCSAIVLRSLPGGVLEYRQAGAPDQYSFGPETHDFDDKLMVAALAQVGFPILRVRGTRSTPVFTLPRFGFSCMKPDGTNYPRLAVTTLAKAYKTQGGDIHLDLETSDPSHPLILAYETLVSRMVLKDLIEEKTKPLIQIVDGPYQAIVTSGVNGRVMDAVRRRFGAPPIPS